ncbi:MAG: DUF2089 domain-containing protein [Acetivibrionales bacterium]|jgi:hypothetical protein|nr:DUF2089 domain-containing protein [Bacillota bacterium]NLP07713.1 DUF2089 domain-containing protein [Clostridiaceae bacterium]HOA54601.1 DUF2089 domain-containing protein [Clostridiales bacterium]HQD30736.1 DUF2089 domain-containing protein [Clostridiales bacterium]
MTREALGKCPVCGQNTEVTAIYCSSCDTKIEGHFTLCRFCRLTAEQKSFIEVFIKCRGNIKEVERELGISYPTVKSRLEDAANALGYGMQNYDDPESERRMEILDRLENGSISVEEALELLK